MSTNKSGLAKKILVPIIIIALLVAAFFIAKKVRTSNTSVEVTPVSVLNWGYMEDSMAIDGFVFDQDSQNIYPDSTLIISEVFVKEGQSVKKGDKLLAYDMASQDLTLQIKKVAVEKAKNSLTTAQAELNALYNTRPVPEYIPPSPSPAPTPSDPEEEAPTKPEQKKTKDAWNYLDEKNVNDYYLDPIITVINNHTSPVPEVPVEEDETNPGTNPDSGSTDNPGQGDSGGSDNPTQGDSGGSDSGSAEGGNDSGSQGTGTDNQGSGTANAGDNSGSESGTTRDNTNIVDPGYEEIEPPEDGSLYNPYRYIVTEDGVIYGSFLNALKQKEHSYAVIEIHDGNTKDGALLASMTISTDKLKEQNEDDYWYVILRAAGDDPIKEQLEKLQENNNSDTSDIGTDYFQDIPTGYTAAELAAAINEKKREIKMLDLDLRRMQLDLKILEEEMEDGVVTAKRDGVVTLVHDKDHPPQDGSAFLKVDAGSGVVVQGTVSELLLDRITTGQEITASDWDSGGFYTGEILSIDDYPQDQSYYYGGNPNSSYYGFLAYFDDAQDLEEGHWLQMSLDANANSEDALYIPNPYIRSDGQGKYVMKDDGGVLAKQYVKCGRGYYGYVTEIKEGLLPEDSIAFPYGDGAEVGAHTVEAEMGGMW